MIKLRIIINGVFKVAKAMGGAGLLVFETPKKSEKVKVCVVISSLVNLHGFTGMNEWP